MTDKKKNKIAKGVSDVISGSFLTKDYVVNNITFILFLVLLLIGFVAWDYNAEKTLKKIAKADREVKELKLRAITIKSQLTNKSLQSQVAKDVYGMGLKESMDPPRVIEDKNK